MIFRVMRKDEDGLPAVEQSARGLGVRAGIDVDVDGQGNVIANNKGMSVAPSWRDISILRIPKRLRDKVPGARGSNSTFCFRAGSGAFHAGPFAAGLKLTVDSNTHGCVAPTETMPLVQFERNLAATQSDWQVDED